MTEIEQGPITLDVALAGATSCLECRFWDHKKDLEGFCRRSAPAPAGRENEITRWRQTRSEDWCGDGEIAVDPLPRIPCGACRFWFRPEHGIDPLQHAGRFSDWWQHAGLCRRHSPQADAELGGRGYWRTTHDDDHCGEATGK
ncbi:hypothetical protein [Beijerinckia sp. L45]|uniref:hypothetical protein n=1 Tax=Beijerinckia sp. L45 TaxID=1641855 RepID=UPI00131DE3D4|nr:hypothetical protein [Beijerinckia sp. L45]